MSPVTFTCHLAYDSPSSNQKSPAGYGLAHVQAGIHFRYLTCHALALQTGKMSNVWFGNVSCQSEAGFVFAGHEKSIIEGITIKDADLELRKSTKLQPNPLDYRPSAQGLLNASSVSMSIPAIFVEYASHVELSSVEVLQSPVSQHQDMSLPL